MEIAEKCLGLSRRRFLSQSALAAMAGVAPSLAAGQASQTPEPTDPAHQAPANPRQTPPAVTHILADWVVRTSPSDVPPASRKEAIRSLVNWVGVTLGGSTQEAVNIALRTIPTFTCPSGASIFGRKERLDLLRAAMIGALSSHVLDFDDTDLRTIIHPAATIAAALFALCQSHQISGAEFLHAFVLGVEVECRLGRAIYPSHYDLGWHITATCGAFGAAAACGKALKLDVHKMEMALGIAATEASGLKITFGSMSKSLGVGRAAENGLFAALLAASGFTGPERCLEGKDGYIQAASLQHDYAVLTSGLGEHFEITHNTYKPFACGIVIHPSIDAILQIRKTDNITPEMVYSIAIRANPLVLELTGKREPRSGLEGKFSIFHSVAVALIRGSAGPDEYSDAAVSDPTVVALRKRVTVATDPAVRSEEAFVTVKTLDGRTLEAHIEHAIGSIERPLTDPELDAKFRLLAKNILPPEQLEQLLAATWKLESSDDVSKLARMGAARA